MSVSDWMKRVGKRMNRRQKVRQAVNLQKAGIDPAGIVPGASSTRKRADRPAVRMPSQTAGGIDTKTMVIGGALIAAAYVASRK